MAANDDAPPSIDEMKRQTGGTSATPSPAAKTTAPDAKTDTDIPTITVTPSSSGQKPTNDPPPSLQQMKTELGSSSAVPQTAKPGDIDPITNRPYQFATSSENTPAGQATGRYIGEAPPDVGIQLKIGMGNDPEQRMRIAAGQLFPDLPLKEALGRFLIGDDGRLAAVGNDGKPYYVDPVKPQSNVSWFSDPYSPGSIASTYTWGEPVLYAHSQVGASMAPVAGAVTGLLAAPTSVVAGPALAAGAAAAADVGRQYIARGLDPAQTPRPIDLTQTGTEAAKAAIAQGTGALALRVASPNYLNLSGPEIRTLGTALPDARTAYQRAEAQGVQLTPGQATNVPGILQSEDAAKSLPTTVNQAADFYRTQGTQLQNAGQNMLDRVSANTDKTDAALDFQQGAADTSRIIRQQANTAAAPFYQAAQRTQATPTPQLLTLMQRPIMQQALHDAITMADNEGRRLPTSFMVNRNGQITITRQPDFEAFDYIKRALDRQFEAASTPTDRRMIGNVRNDFLTEADRMYPTYAQARAAAQPGQRQAAQLEATGVGTAGSGMGDEQARAILAPVFEQNPRYIAGARQAFVDAGQESAWNSGLRSYIQDAIDRASTSQDGLNPTMLRRQIWGNVDKREAIQAAMTPQQLAGFNNFLETVEDIARTYPAGSPTAMRLAGQANLLNLAENQANVRAYDVAGSSLKPWDWIQGALAGRRSAAVQQNLQNIVMNLFSPDGMPMLEQMAMFTPGRQRAINLATQIMQRSLSTSPQLPGREPTAQEAISQFQAGRPVFQNAPVTQGNPGPASLPYP